MTTTTKVYMELSVILELVELALTENERAYAIFGKREKWGIEVGENVPPVRNAAPVHACKPRSKRLGQGQPERVHAPPQHSSFA